MPNIVLASECAQRDHEPAFDEAVAAVYDRCAASRLVKQLDEERKTAVEQLKHVVYFHRSTTRAMKRHCSGDPLFDPLRPDLHPPQFLN